jgi:hypothetical protein
MTQIGRPRHPGRYPDRAIDCEQEMDLAICDLIDRAQLSGWTTPELLDAIESVAKNQRLAYAEDPDPADDMA